MTKKKAINVLSNLSVWMLDLPNEQRCDLDEAIEVALSALCSTEQDRVKRLRGGWEICQVGNGWNDWCECTCKVCGYHDNRPNFPVDGFCPACGSPMSDKAVNLMVQRLEEMNDG